MLGTDLPKSGQELSLNVKFDLSKNDVTGVWARLSFTGADGKTVESAPIKLTLDGKTVTGIVKGTSSVDAAHVSLVVWVTVEETEEEKGSAVITAENGKGIPTQGTYFSVEADSAGIKITFPDNLKVAKDSGTSISVKGIPLKIIVTNEDRTYALGDEAFS